MQISSYMTIQYNALVCLGKLIFLDCITIIHLVTRQINNYVLRHSNALSCFGKLKIMLHYNAFSCLGKLLVMYFIILRYCNALSFLGK